MWTQAINTAADTVNKTLLKISELLYYDGTGKSYPCACQEGKWGSGSTVQLIWDFSVSHPGHFTTGTHQIGCWVDPRVCNNTLEKSCLDSTMYRPQTTRWCGELLAIWGTAGYIGDT